MDDYLPSIEPLSSDIYVDPPQEKKRRRMLSDKQKEALKMGRQRRWSHLANVPQDPYLSTQQEPEMPPPPPPEPVQKQHPFFDLNSSESSSEDDSEEEKEEHVPQPVSTSLPQLGKSKTKKPKIPSAIKRRVDRYIEQKLQESMMSGRGIGSSSGGVYVQPSPAYRLQYL